MGTAISARAGIESGDVGIAGNVKRQEGAHAAEVSEGSGGIEEAAAGSANRRDMEEAVRSHGRNEARQRAIGGETGV